MNTRKTQQGTQFPIVTTAAEWPVHVMGTGEAPRQRDKASPQGEVTHATGTLLRVQGRDGTLRVDKSASVHVIIPRQPMSWASSIAPRGVSTSCLTPPTGAGSPIPSPSSGWSLWPSRSPTDQQQRVGVRAIGVGTDANAALPITRKGLSR